MRSSSRTSSSCVPGGSSSPEELAKIVGPRPRRSGDLGLRASTPSPSSSTRRRRWPRSSGSADRAGQARPLRRRSRVPLTATLRERLWKAARRRGIVAPSLTSDKESPCAGSFSWGWCSSSPSPPPSLRRRPRPPRRGHARVDHVGGTFPLTGPASLYATIPVAMKAYFSYVNNGRARTASAASMAARSTSSSTTTVTTRRTPSS